jgi:hypothetical protein
MARNIRLGILVAVAILWGLPAWAGPIQSTAALRDMLAKAGYEVPAEVQEDEWVVFRKKDEDGWEVSYSFTLSRDKSIVYAVAGLKTYKDATANPQMLVDMLVYNDTHRTFFSYDNQTGRFYMNYQLANIDVTDATLKTVVDRLGAAVRDTEAIWDPQSASPTGQEKP